MKKSILLNALVVLVFTSCKTLQFTGNPIGHLAVQSSEIIDWERVNEWQHADIKSENFPGMSVRKAYEELLRLQPNFNKLKEDEKFIKWLDKQPESISNGILKNNSDAKWASRIVDLYYLDSGSKKSAKIPDAATSITSKGSKEVNVSQKDGKIWKASEIQKMNPWEFEKLEKDIDLARAEGRVDFNS